MPAKPSASTPNTDSTDPNVQASALWAYVKAKAPHFSLEEAIAVIRQLELLPGEDPKAVAKRLRKVLQGRQIAFKHTHALHAASCLAGFSSWHTNEQAGKPRLRLTTYDGSNGFAPESLQMREFASWSDLATELRDWTDRIHARGQLPLGILALQFTETSLNFSTPVPADKGDVRQQPQSWPLGGVSPILDDEESGWRARRRRWKSCVGTWRKTVALFSTGSPSCSSAPAPRTLWARLAQCLWRMLRTPSWYWFAKTMKTTREPAMKSPAAMR